MRSPDIESSRASRLNVRELSVEPLEPGETRALANTLLGEAHLAPVAMPWSTRSPASRLATRFSSPSLCDTLNQTIWPCDESGKLRSVFVSD